MARCRRFRKLISLVFLVGFLFATLEIHADHDTDVAQKTQHCCVQCCPSHNLAPINQVITAVDASPLLDDFIVCDESLPLKEIPESIFRPPISLG